MEKDLSDLMDELKDLEEESWVEKIENERVESKDDALSK